MHKKNLKKVCIVYKRLNNNYKQKNCML